MSDRDVIGVALVLSGSQGNELLYRNPQHKKALSAANNDSLNKSGGDESLRLLSSDQRPPEFSEFSSFDDELLGHICVLKPSRCGRLFHLEIDRVAFVGCPVSWDGTMLHLVFATKANLHPKLIEQLSKLSQKAALMLLQEAEIMKDPAFDSIHLHEGSRSQDDVGFRSSAYTPASCSDSSSASGIKCLSKQKSYIGSQQRRCRKLGEFLSHLTHIEVGTSLCLTLPSGAPFSAHIHANPDKVKADLDRLSAYHTLLLSPDLVKDSSEEFPTDFSTAICAVIGATCCSKPLYQIAADTDLTLRYVMKIAAHLVFWDRAKIAYPICQSRTYLLKLSSNGLLYVKSTIGRDLKCPESSSELFETFLSFCGSSGGQFELGVLYERLCLIAPDLQWAHLRNFINSLLWCRYVTEIHNYPIYHTFFTSAPPDQRDEIQQNAASVEEMEDGDKCKLDHVLKDLDGRVHIDALAYKLNMATISLQGKLKSLEQQGKIICCYRIENDSLLKRQWFNSTDFNTNYSLNMQTSSQ